ncbi:sugar ABC transporter permease [Enterococcus diestrammenae]|uniref:sugar ABC transporter permease n=1 Tax=Enterococcus diestrammenae TaxID=1155073 RepID=UPI0019582E85
MKKKNFLDQTLLTIIALIWLFPIAWIVLTSFRSEGGRFVSYIVPKSFTLSNYQNLFQNDNYPFATWFFNTLFVSVISCILSTIITIAMAYTLSRLRFRFRKKILKIALVLNMFPGFMSMIAVYYILKAMNLTQSLFALILVYSSGAALGFYIAKGFFDTIPRSLDESAMIDGATKFDIFIHITIPLSKPIIVYTMLMAFIAPWMDFIFAKVIMGDNVEKYTVAIGLFSMMTRSSANSNYMSFAAGCVLIAIPITLLFMKLQKYYVEGITGGAVKG